MRDLQSVTTRCRRSAFVLLPKRTHRESSDDLTQSAAELPNRKNVQPLTSGFPEEFTAYLSKRNAMSKTAADHHRKASEHSTHAAKHHGEAAKQHDAGQHEKAAHHAQTASGHEREARMHSGEAAKAHANEHGKK